MILILKIILLLKNIRKKDKAKLIKFQIYKKKEKEVKRKEKGLYIFKASRNKRKTFINTRILFSKS